MACLCRIVYTISILVSFSKEKFGWFPLTIWRNAVVHLKTIMGVLKLPNCPDPECVIESLKFLESLMLSGSLLKRSVMESLCSWSSGRDTAPARTLGNQRLTCRLSWSRLLKILTLIQFAWKKPEKESVLCWKRDESSSSIQRIGQDLSWCGLLPFPKPFSGDPDSTNRY